MRYLIDTIVLIWAVRDLHEARTVLTELRGGDCVVSAITLLELGRALTPEERLDSEARRDRLAVLPVDEPVARAAGDYLARCATEGHRVDFFAGIIAATAAHHDRTLATYSPFQYLLAPCELVPLSTVDGPGRGAP